jgi:stage V sporulation protein S
VTTFKVKGDSNVQKLAGAISNSLREQSELRLQAIGGPAVNTAIKGLAIARTFLAPEGYDVWIQPGFVDLDVLGKGVISGIEIWIRATGPRVTLANPRARSATPA